MTPIEETKPLPCLLTREHIEKVIKNNRAGIAAHQLFKELEKAWNTQLHLANQQVEELEQKEGFYCTCLKISGTGHSQDTPMCPKCQLESDRERAVSQITKLEAACAEKDEALRCADRYMEGLLTSALVRKKVIEALSTTSGQRILEENEKMSKLLQSVASSMEADHTGYKDSDLYREVKQALNPTNQTTEEKE